MFRQVTEKKRADSNVVSGQTGIAKKACRQLYENENNT